MASMPVVTTSGVDDERRFGGLARLYGVAGAQRVRRAHVAVVGIGGVGSWAAEALARSGVARLSLIDMDHVAESNINRQIHATERTLGQAKVQAMRERIALIHPQCDVRGIEEFVTPDNWPAVLDREVDAVIDACDQMRAKVAMAQWAMRTRAHFITVGAAGGKRHADKVEVGDIAHATHDPLIAQLRYRLRREAAAPREGRMRVPCVFSREAVAPPDASCAVEGDGSLNCHGYGSLVTVTAAFGFCAAGWIINQLAQTTDLAPEASKNAL